MFHHEKYGLVYEGALSRRQLRNKSKTKPNLQATAPQDKPNLQIKPWEWRIEF